MAEEVKMCQPFRLAVEGCGHGKLHDIYAAVKETATLRGWDGVDLLIIGGDFQAVRNSNDLTCMAVPNKYKTIGDFHEYYSGVRVAPYLTVFVGGNHEASNYMFELHYGGWVAPNIYYLGAANVIRCGPLRIAGMSGIWKGYDYHKPHLERIPYDGDSLRSVYHTREIDIRKLLQIRTQVDVGVSHDWPRGIEWAGDYNRLFRFKRHIREDAEQGILGSVAAKLVLDRLRPSHWFSAHLHCKYTATVQHGEYEPAQVRGVFDNRNESIYKAIKNEDDAANIDATRLEDVGLPGGDSKSNPIQTPQHSTNDGEKKHAWHDFYNVAARTDQEEQDLFMQEVHKYHKQVEAGDIKPGSDVTYQLKWKKVGVDDGTGREVQDIITTSLNPVSDNAFEKPTNAIVKNDDEIDLDLEDARADQEAKRSTTPSKTDVTSMIAKNADEINIDLEDAEEDLGRENAAQNGPESTNAQSEEETQKRYENKDRVQEDIRNQLPASFTKGATVLTGTKSKPIVESTLPPGITNTVTEFVAADKCEGHRDFLHLTEILPISKDDGTETQTPYRLRYDKEWLAITRALHPGFSVGEATAGVPFNKGDGGYRADIIAAEEWVEENICRAGKMYIPLNFSIVAPVYDASIPVFTTEQPLEYPNPQTAEFCDLIGIENVFSMTDEKRAEQLEHLTKVNDNAKLNGGIFNTGGKAGGRGGRSGRGNRNGGRGAGRGGRGGRGGRTRGRGGPY